MKKHFLLLAIGLLAVLMLAGCGEKSKTDVVENLDKKVEELSGYKAKAQMTLQTGSEPQIYEVEIWHKQPSFYRVNLKNAEKDQSQMILRNNEGVFVLTPALKKSFRFQSEWPQNSSQAYLFESLVKDIKSDADSIFKSTKDAYVFETKTNYQNSQMLPLQEITFNKKDLKPSVVKVMDTDRNPLVVVEFSDFDFDAKFDKNSFDMQKNMSFASVDVETSASVNSEPFAVKYPLEQIEGVKLTEEKEMKTENGKRVVQTYDGEKSYTFIQEKAVAATVATSSFVSGEPVDLGVAVGALTEQSLTWTFDGVEYMIASKDLSQEEIIRVAQSVQGQAIK
ncbi:outer membrane lipoprotein carrier protein LolA [Metabacillus idriensis]|uniref:LolA family protein n=1 Tax=Metabacillus idriensis TaxID=324768 RepID=UPI0028142B30|nr:outer membrane lipoprotein carrier protein LolA [Metabacillus idriensis]MDR0140232.1 outer membrane lipoprotein carrier protein LolA [Metabacillus idriensis]